MAKQAKSSKHDRNRKWCQIYKSYGTRIKNKRKKLIRHMKKYPNDRQAEKALNNL